MLKEPLISIIIPAYNVQRYIGKCIESIVQQTYDNIQVIIVNDGSTDETEEICRNYAEAYDYVQLWCKENGGAASARNYGLSKAKGQYIGFVDGDDYVEPDMYEVLLKHLLENNASAAICKIVYEEEGRPKAVSKNNQNQVTVYSNEDLLLRYLQGKDFTTVCNKLLSRNIAMRTFPDIVIGEDAVYLFDLFLNPGTAAAVDKQLYHYVQHSGSARVTKFNPKHLDSLRCSEMVFDKIRGSCPKFLPYAMAFKFKYYIGTLARIYVWDAEKEYAETLLVITAEIKNLYKPPQKNLMPKLTRLAWLGYCINKPMFRLIMKQYYQRTLYKVMEKNYVIAKS
ncbi:MAG: glycosyltransferase family 2 protein [Lachnospiraceae bacterium]